MTVATFSRSSFLQAHMKNRSYHSHHTSDHETGMCRYAGSRQQAEHGNWPLEILLQNWAVWKHENPMNLVPADRIRTHLNIWWFVNLLSRIPDPWFVSGCLGFFSSTFCCLFWFLTCPSRQYVRSSSGHFSLDLYMLCKLLGFGKWLQTRHLMSLSMR